MIDPHYIVLDGVEVAVFVLEPGDDGRIEYTAVNHLLVAGAQKYPADVRGCTAEQVFPDRSDEVAYAHHQKAVQTLEKQEYDTILTLGDIPHHVHTTLHPMLDKYGTLERIIGTSTITTDAHHEAEQRTQTKAAERERERRLAIAAHDLRTPMRNVLAITEMIREDIEEGGEDTSDLLDLMDSVAAKAKVMITDILSATQEGLISDEVETFQLRYLGSQMMILLDPTKQHTLTTCDAEITAERIALQIIFRNLCDNAIKHCGQDSVTLDITLRIAAKGFLEFCVCDNGTGFKNPESVFEKSKNSYSESGFGLSGVQQLVNGRGGTISASNTSDGHGGCVRFTFPGTLVSEVVAGSVTQAPVSLVSQSASSANTSANRPLH